MLAAEVPARTIIEVPGHSEISVTMNTHAQVLAQLRQARLLGQFVPLP